MDNVCWPKPGEVIQIKRLCSGKIQPNVDINHLFKVLGAGNTPTGIPVLRVVDIYSHSGCETRINAKRFRWTIISPKDMTDTMWKGEQRMVSYADELDEKLDKVKDVIVIARATDSVGWRTTFAATYAPVLYVALALYFAKSCKRVAVERQTSALLPTSRKVDKLYSTFLARVKSGGSRQDIPRIESLPKEFIDQYNMDFTILWTQITQILTNRHKGKEADEMHAHALMGLIVLDSMRLFIAAIYKRITRGSANVGVDDFHEIANQIAMCLTTYAADDCAVDISKGHLRASAQVIANRMLDVEWEASVDNKTRAGIERARELMNTRS